MAQVYIWTVGRQGSLVMWIQPYTWVNITASEVTSVGCLLVAGVDAEKDERTGRVQPTPLLCSTRLGLSIIGFFMFFHLYAQRVGMSVAIVSMVNQTAVSMMGAGIFLHI